MYFGTLVTTAHCYWNTIKGILFQQMQGDLIMLIMVPIISMCNWIRCWVICQGIHGKPIGFCILDVSSSCQTGECSRSSFGHWKAEQCWHLEKWGGLWRLTCDLKNPLFWFRLDPVRNVFSHLCALPLTCAFSLQSTAAGPGLQP